MARSAARVRSRLVVWALGLATLAVLFTLALVAPLASAQEDKKPDKAEPKAEAKSDTSASSSSSSGSSSTSSAGAPNLFMHLVSSAGWVFGPLLLLVSIGLVALIVLLVLDLRMGNAIPPGFVEDFTDTVNKRQFKQAYEMAREDDSFLGRVMTAGMARLQYGLEDAREGALNMVDNIKAGKDGLIAYLATIGTLGPLLGLVGTVWGMIRTFMALARPGSEFKIEEVTAGISHALVITLIGIGLSVPAIFFHAFFKNRLRRISLDVTSIADDLLTQMYYNSRKGGAAATGATGATPVNATPGVISPAELVAADAAAVATARGGPVKPK